MLCECSEGDEVNTVALRPNTGQQRQTGSIVIVALISVLSVAGVAAGTNALLTQDAVTSDERTRQIQGITVADSLRNWVDENGFDASFGNALYEDGASFEVTAEKETGSNWYNGYVSIGSIEYGYSFSTSGQNIPVTENLADAAPGSTQYCETTANRSEIVISCDLKNESVTLSQPWLINGGDREVELEIELQNTDLTFSDDVVLRGSDVEISIEDSRNSPIRFDGALVTQATAGEADFEVKSLRNRSFIIKEGLVVEGQEAETIFEDIRNTPIQIEGPYVVNALSGTAKAEFKDIRQRELTISGGVRVAGEGAVFKLEEFRNTTTTFGDSFTVEGGSNDAIAEFKSFRNRRLTFEDTVSVAGSKAELKVEDVNNAQLEWGGNIQIAAEQDEANLTIKTMMNKTIDLSGAVLLTGRKADIEIDDLRNVTTRFSAPVVLSAQPGSAEFIMKSLRNKDTRFSDDFWIQGQDPELVLEGLEWHDIDFTERILVAPNDVAITRKGSGALRIGAESATDNLESEPGIREFESVQGKNASDVAAVLESERVDAPSAEDIKGRIDYPGNGGGGNAAVERRAVR
jgi:hypothetical protein